MIDIVNELNAIQRETGKASTGVGEAHKVVVRRRYAAEIEDVWDAITNPDRINRWFLPISGDLRLGGTYQLKGNAGGEILRCEPPKLLKVSWVMGEPSEDSISEVEVRLSPAADGDTALELEHVATVDPEFSSRYGPGAVGVGWDLSLLGLGLHLAGGSIDDADAWVVSAEAREFMTGSSRAWGAAMEAAGASAAEVATAVENTTRFYVPDPGAGQGEAG